MANRPDEFSIKFWLDVDVEFKYISNALSYLGKDEARPATQKLSESVVIKIVEPYLAKGRSVTTDNFFTSTHLATQLWNKKTSLVGTLNKIRKEVPPLVKALQQSRYSSEILANKKRQQPSHNLDSLSVQTKQERFYS